MPRPKNPKSLDHLFNFRLSKKEYELFRKACYPLTPTEILRRFIRRYIRDYLAVSDTDSASTPRGDTP